MRSDAPAVSVTICLHNSSRYICDTIESVLAQTFQDFEIVLVDDGSTDGCAERIARQFRGARMTIVRQRHRGLGVARQVSIACATGEFIAFLDHDDLWLPTKLERQVAAARRGDGADLVFSDCLYVDANGRTIGRLSDQFNLAALDLTGARAHLELLKRGNFISLPTVLARTDAVRRVGGVNAGYQYVEDYDLWLRLARQHRFRCVLEPLAAWRVHGGQFTWRHPDVALREQAHVLTPMARSASYPPDVRHAVHDYLFGQHRECARRLLRQGRAIDAARAAAGVWRYPSACAAAATHAARRPYDALHRRYPRARNGLRIARLHAINALRRARVLPRRPPPAMTHIWVDGTALGEAQTGYFNFLCELIRSLRGRPGTVVHVTCSAAGRAALRARFDGDVSGLRFHASGWRTTHWSEIHHRFLLGRLPASRFTARVVRYLWRRVPRPRGRAPAADTVEVLVWRGRFRWKTSHRIAVIQDMTTRVHPELHTAGNVQEFDEYLGYVQRHAHTIATISESSRRDIVERIAVSPESVAVMPMPTSPAWERPTFSRGDVTLHGVTSPYLLCVGTIEPRKNLRRLVRAFELLKDEPALRTHELVLIGADGWDPDFRRFLWSSDVEPRVRMLGFVPGEHLPSLYHFASAVVYPSVYEGYGLPVFEAMCSSAVVLASRASSLPEVLGDAGALFDPYSAESIAAALLAAVTLSPDDAWEYRRRCRLRAELLMARRAAQAPLPGLPLPEMVLA